MNKLTIIEFFDHAPIENMISCLTMKPEKIIFIGASEQIAEDLKQYYRFAKYKKLKTKIEYRIIRSTELEDIVHVFSEIMETEQDCSFDLTGGNDLLLVAIGMVYERYRRQKSIRLHRFDLKTGKILDCDGDGNTFFSDIPRLSIKDHICLYGGKVVSSGVSGTSLSPELKAAVNTLWEINKQNPSEWNKAAGALTKLERYRSFSRNPLYIQLDLSSISQQVQSFEEQKKYALYLLKQLQKVKLISHLSVTASDIKYTYKNKSVKYCLSKSGNLLELKVLMEAASVTPNGLPLYHDSLNGVCVEWDNEMTPKYRFSYDTKNEIDIILMHRLTPVFISCKNGYVNEDELYKLNTVALRFGGGYVKKALIVTDLAGETSEQSLQYFRQRAKDMDITLIDHACDLKHTEWQRLLADIILE